MRYVGRVEPGDFGCLGGLGRGFGEWSAPESGGNDAGLHVIVEAGEAFHRDLVAGFFGDLAAHSLLECLVCFEDPSGGCH